MGTSHFSIKKEEIVSFSHKYRKFVVAKAEKAVIMKV